MKVVFITNRGGTHPNRELYFNSIDADYEFVDFKIRWHGISTSKIKMILSGLVCAITFPERKKYNLFVTSDPQLPAVLMKVLGLLRKDQKVVSYLGSQTLFFTYSNYFSMFTRWYYKFLLSQYDAHICNGPLQASLLRAIIKVPNEKVFVNFNGISAERSQSLKSVSYNTRSNTIMFIGNLYSDWRLHYKGVDLLLDAFARLKEFNFSLILNIVGDHDESLMQLIEKKIPVEYRSSIEITGQVQNLSQQLSNAVLYVHPSRGDALPNSLTEALYAGVPAMVSEWTGGCDIVKKIDSNLVCALDSKSVYESIRYFLSLSENVKKAYSIKAKELTADLTEQHALLKFKSIIHEIENL